MFTEGLNEFGFGASSMMKETISRFNSRLESATPSLTRFVPSKSSETAQFGEQPVQSKLRMSARLRQKECKYLLWRYALQDFSRTSMRQLEESDYMIRDYVNKMRDTIRVQMNDLRLFGQFLDSWV